jgi:hypothetical protein
VIVFNSNVQPERRMKEDPTAWRCNCRQLLGPSRWRINVLRLRGHEWPADRSFTVVRPVPIASVS